MRYLKDLDHIDWAGIQSHNGPAEHFPDLIRQYIESCDEEDRIEASEELWTDAMSDGFLSEAVPYLAEFMVPLLNEDDRSDRAIILMNLGHACRYAREPNKRYAVSSFSAASAETLRVIEQGFESYLGLFREHPELRNLVALIVTCYPHRADEYLPLLLAEFATSSDDFEKAELLVCLDRIADQIPDFDEIQLTAASDRSSTTLQYLASCIYVAHHGEGSPERLISFIEDTSPEVPMPRGARRLMHLPTVECLRRALRALSNEKRVSSLIRILPKVSSTLWAHYLMADLMEAVSGKTGIVVFRDYDDYSLIGTDPTPIRLAVVPGTSDWIPAVINCEPSWTDDALGGSVQTNLFELFGLPSTRDGLIAVWESIYGTAVPIPGERCE
jgi:hypothetical protein